MTAPVFPEDSILRRHFESRVHFRRLEWLRLPPGDSVLRRHTQPLSRPAPTAASRAAAARPAMPSTPASARVQAARPGGFGGWLRRLFGI